MRRVKLWFVGIAAAAGMVVGAGAYAPAADAADLVELCITLHPRSADIVINGTPVFGTLIPGVPRSCVGI